MDDIYKAFFLGDLRDALRLLDDGLDVNSTDKFGNTLLIKRCLGPGDRDEDGLILDVLLERGAEVDRQNNQGSTGLSYAAARQNRQYVARLIQAGANINHQNNDGWTPLMAAVGDANGEVIELLLDSGADRNIMDFQGRTVLDIARNFTSQYWHPEDELSDSDRDYWDEHHQHIRESLVALLNGDRTNV